MRWGVVVVAALVLGGACKKKAEPLRDPKLENKVATREITLYYESQDLMLVPERRTLPLPEREAAALPIVVRELIKGSANSAVPKLFPPDIVVRGVYSLPDGTAIVDLGSASIGTTWSPGSHGELMSIYSLVQTLTSNFSSIRSVRLLLNGQVTDTFAGHIRLDRPLRPMPLLVAKSGVPAAAPVAAPLLPLAAETTTATAVPTTKTATPKKKVRASKPTDVTETTGTAQ